MLSQLGAWMLTATTLAFVPPPVDPAQPMPPARYEPGRAVSTGASFHVLGDWSVTCDNILSCTALSVSPELKARLEAEDVIQLPRPYLRVERQSDWDNTPRVFLDMRRVPGDQPRTAASIPAVTQVQLTGFPPNPFPARRRRTTFDLTRIEDGLFAIDAAQVEPFMQAAKDARFLLVLADEGPVHGLVSLDGFVDAINHIDALQMRTDTITSIFRRRGIRSPLAPLMPPPIPVLRAVGGSHGVAPNDTTWDFTRVCGVGAARSPDDVLFGDMQNGIRIIGIMCVATGLNPGRIWLTQDQRGAQRPVDLPMPDAGAGTYGLGFLENSSFDAGTGILSSVAYQGYHRDCGTKTRWQWTTNGFQLLDASSMPVCMGMPEQAWPRTWLAVRLP